MEKETENKLLNYAVGVGSILDLSGDASSFEGIAQHQEFEGDWEAIGKDFDAVGDCLQEAIIAYFKTLSHEKQIGVVKDLLKVLSRSDALRASPSSSVTQNFSTREQDIDLYSAE